MHAMPHITCDTHPSYRLHDLHFYSAKRSATPNAIIPPVKPSGAKLSSAPAVTTWSEGDASDEPVGVPLARGDTTVCEYVCPSDTKVLVKVVRAGALPVGAADTTVCNCVCPLEVTVLKNVTCGACDAWLLPPDAGAIDISVSYNVLPADVTVSTRVTSEARLSPTGACEIDTTVSRTVLPSEVAVLTRVTSEACTLGVGRIETSV